MENKYEKKNAEELNVELFNLLREQFNLNMQTVNGKLKQTHLIRQARRNIARVKTILTLKADTV